MGGLPTVDWLLDCEPRPGQIEALLRSYRGVVARDHKDDPWPETPKLVLPHGPRPAVGFGHFMEMRVGKTPTLLNEFMLFKRDFGLRKMLVVAPNKYKHSWAKEALRFGVDVPTFVFDSSTRKQFKEFMKHPESLVAVNYEAVNSDANLALLHEYVDDRTIIGADESVLIKNKDSLTFKKLLDLSKSAAITRALTGKPTPQGVHDLYSQMRFIRALDGWNFYQFRNKFALMGGFKGKQVIGVKNEDQLRELGRRHYFFARRADWGTSIETDYEIVPLEMTPAQKKTYDEMEEDFVTWLDDGVAVSTDQVITKHIKLQQISSGFIIDEDGHVHDVMPFEKTPKFIELKDRLENYIDGKTIIIAHFVETADRLMEHLKVFNPAVIRGEVHMKKMGRDVETEKARFNEDPSCRVMIGQSRAIKYGHTLMGSKDDPCLATVYFENSYSLDDRAQSEQRNQGEGQLGAIHVMDFSSSPVETRVVEALQRKENVAAKIMGYYKEG